LSDSSFVQLSIQFFTNCETYHFSQETDQFSQQIINEGLSIQFFTNCKPNDKGDDEGDDEGDGKLKYLQH
jgi:hypothetical protein